MYSDSNFVISSYVSPTDLWGKREKKEERRKEKKGGRGEERTKERMTLPKN